MKKRKATVQSKKIIAERVNRLRRLGAPVSASDGYDLRALANWTPQRLAALRRYENQLSDFLDSMPILGAVRVFPRSKKMKDAIARTFYVEAKKPKWIKGEFIPNFGSKKIRLSLDKDGNLAYTDESKKKFFEPLDPLQMAVDLKGYFSRVYSRMVKKGGTVFILTAGNHYFRPGNYNSGMFVTEDEGYRMLNSLMEKYDTAGKWLKNIEAYKVDKEEYESRVEAAFFVNKIISAHNKDREKERKKRITEYKRIRRQMARKKGPTRNII